MRTRDIKPGFYLNEQLAECSPWARLIFPGLWMLADREGRLEYRPKRIKAELLPYDGEDMALLLGELETHGLVKRYEVDGKEYLWIPTFSRHQKPHPNEKQSEIPPCPDEPGQHEAQNHTMDENTSCQGDTDLSPRCEASITKEISAPHQGDIQSGLLSYTPLPGDINTLTSFECLSPPDDGDPSPALRVEENSSLTLMEQAAPKAPACPYEAIVGLYHAILPEHPRVKLVDKKRQGTMKARWGDVGLRLRTEKQRDGPKERLDYMRRFFEQASRSDFLTGKKAFRDGSVYIVDFDKLMSPNGFKRLIEGVYDNKQESA